MYMDARGREFDVLHADGRKPFRVVYRRSKYAGWRYVAPLPWFAQAGDALDALKAYAERYDLRQVKAAF